MDTRTVLILSGGALFLLLGLTFLFWSSVSENKRKEKQDKKLNDAYNLCIDKILSGNIKEAIEIYDNTIRYCRSNKSIYISGLICGQNIEKYRDYILKTKLTSYREI